MKKNNIAVNDNLSSPVTDLNVMTKPPPAYPAGRPLLRRLLGRMELAFRLHVLDRLFHWLGGIAFYRVFGGHVYFQALRAAVEFDLFTILEKEGALTEPEIAAKLGIELQPCRTLLLPLVTTGMLRKRADRYSCTLVSRLLLTTPSRYRLVNYVRLQHEVYYRAMPHFYESLKANRNLGVSEFKGSGATLYERLESDPKLERIFQLAMEELSQHSNAQLAKCLDLRKVRHLVDVGGGNGSNILALAKENPHLQASVFDFPGVGTMARANIEKHQSADRLSVIEGNCFTDPFPTGADCFLFCHFFTMWSKDEDLLLLKKAYAALPKGGRAIIFNMMQHNNRTGPISAGLGSPYFQTIATGRGMLYTWDEYTDLFRQAGFSKVHRHRLPRHHGVIVGVRS